MDSGELPERVPEMVGEGNAIAHWLRQQETMNWVRRGMDYASTGNVLDKELRVSVQGVVHARSR